jgi:hypothetical protein
MGADPVVLGASAGHKVVRDGPRVRFVERGTRGPAILAWLTGGGAVIALGHGVLWPVLAMTGEAPARAGLLGGLIGGVAGALLVLACVAATRAYRRRARAPVLGLPALVADLERGALFAADGRRLADLAEVTVDAPMNLGDSTQGFMRRVRLRWKGGRAYVYNAASRDAKRLRDVLVALGIGRADR